MCLAGLVDASDDQSSENRSPLNDSRHRLELGYTSIDGFDGDLLVLTPSYTFSKSPHLRFTGSTQLVKLSVPKSADSDSERHTGLGDSIVTVQFDPGARLTASPWVPDTVGVFGAFLLPTGDVDEGLGLDAWAASIGAGWPLAVSDSFMAAPTLFYTRTFAHGDDAARIEELGIGVTLLWLSPIGAWLGIEPFISRDLENNENIDSYSLVIGKTFRNGLGVDLRWGTQHRFENFAERDDEVFLLSISWQFGDPPN